MSTESDEMIIETEGVKVNFGDFWALKGVDISVRKGEIIVILGPSGSGKSTLIRCINRLEEHQDGKIIVDGNEMSENTKNMVNYLFHYMNRDFLRNDRFIMGKVQMIPQNQLERVLAWLQLKHRFSLPLAIVQNIFRRR